MTVDYNKPLTAIYEIEGITNEYEKNVAGDVLMKIYNMAADIVNNGGIDEFNRTWKLIHPNWNYKDESKQDEYMKAYDRYFKQVADMISESVRTPSGLTYKLRETECCLINFKKGYLKLYGYKDQK